MKNKFCTNEVTFPFLPGLRLLLVYSFPHAVDDPEEMTAIQEWRVTSLCSWAWSACKDTDDKFRDSKRDQTQKYIYSEVVFLT